MENFVTMTATTRQPLQGSKYFLKDWSTCEGGTETKCLEQVFYSVTYSLPT